MVHIASVWVPFTSESKEAIAHYPEIIKEMRLALQECGRRLGQYVSRRDRARGQAKRREVFNLYLEEVAASVEGILGGTQPQFRDALRAISKKRTELADMVEGDEGDGAAESLEESSRVLIVERERPSDVDVEMAADSSDDADEREPEQARLELE